ncbi:hypothetical protein H5410_037738 [Solanum commersonii]|uniref:Uncharacterized protein n=1 Tax=Solanum commersonii TaxID=4109 RepID=A0A9J5Y8U1_SOLCO|nr:hypothetical protein H5410_037738 [Solanum commersonii]
MKFERILDYKDELLRIKYPGTSCVVKKAWIHCRKCLCLDGCFLKGVCKSQLLVDVAKDDNN